MTKKWSIVATALAGVVMCGALVYYNFIDKKKVVEGVAVGDTCPDFTVDTIAANDGVFGFDGNEYNLYANNGKVRVINFWATWCGGCKEEMPHFNEFAKAYPEVEVIAICGESGPKDVVAEWMNTDALHVQASGWANFSLQFGFYGPDDENVYYSLGGTSMLPMTVVVDEDGVIRYNKEKNLDFEGLQQIVLPLLND